MSIFTSSGSGLSAAFAVAGGRLSRAYALDGRTLWNARGVESFAYAGPQTPWSSWKFYKVSDTADPSYTSTAEAAVAFDDTGWQTVTIPHDWSIYNSFNASSPATYEGGYLDGGDAWYRCHFTVTEEMLSDQTLLYFDGVYMECVVYLNGRKVGENRMGYAPFWLDISNVIAEGENVLAVFVRNRQPSSRWYSGSGIFRPVYLLTLEGAGKWISDTYVTTPDLEAQREGGVTTHVEYTVHNSDAAAAATATLTIYKDGVQVAAAQQELTLPEGETQASIELTVSAPALWDVGQPNLYELELTLTGSFGSYTAPRVVYGYRWTKWDVDTGFWLNGKNIKLKGVCMHHDLGCIGAEVNRSAMERQIDSMVEMGANAIRLTHNPGSTLFLELCRDKGVLVVEELFDCWTRAKKAYDFARYFTSHYAEVVENTVRRSINNPAVIMWSLGNEINGGNNELDYTAEEAASVCSQLIAAVKSLDTTRPVTMGQNYQDTDSGVFRNAVNPLLDVCGVNYNSDDLTVPHELGKPSYGSETTSALSSRGIYKHDSTTMQCSSYDDDRVSWGSYAADALKAHMDSAYSGGMFVWTGWDYIGEPTPYNKYPAKSSYFGICDLAGFPKDIYYMYQARLTTTPMLHILPTDWDSWEEGKTVEVWLYSNCPTVELFVNGSSAGKKTQDDLGDKYQIRYYVVYTKGVLTAKGYDAEGNVVATDEVKSSDGTPAKLSLTAYKPTVDVTTDDLVFVTCDVQDKDGTFVPRADTKVTFTCEGGTVLGTDNGHAACVEPLRSNVKSAFNGKVLCVCRHDGTEGTLTVTATADGLTVGSVTVQKTIGETG